MIQFVAVLFLTAVMAACNSGSQGPGEDGWELVWQDEFEGSGAPDGSKWERVEYNRKPNHLGPDGWWLADHAYLDGQGHLVIKVDTIGDRNSDGDAFDYAVGAVRSIHRFEQAMGKFEIRCQLPAQPGWWVAFWLFSPEVVLVDGSGEDGTEIDIMEGFGWTDKIFHALHWDGYGEAHQSVAHDSLVAGIRQGFHTFTLEWYEDEYIWYIDGQESWRSSGGGVSKVPAYVKVTGEISTEAGATGTWWANDPSQATFPDYYIIDYVKVWKQVKP